MRKALLAIIMFALSLPQVCLAAEIQTGNTYMLAPDIAIEDNLIVVSGEIEINGTVKGDVFAAGGEIHIRGIIEGDLMAAGGNIMIHEGAVIQKNAHLAGGQITIDGSVNKDINLFTGEGYISGPVKGNIRAEAGSLQLNSIVSGSIKASAENITLKAKSIIDGDFKYKSPNDPIKEEGSQVKGATIKLEDTSQLVNKYSQTSFWASFFTSIVSYWIIGMLFLAFFANCVQRNTILLQNQFWKNMGIGLLSIIVSIITSIILMVTIIGIPLGIITLFASIVLIYLGQLSFAFYLTQKMAKIAFDQEHNRITTALLLFISILLLSLVELLPVIGGLIKVGLTLVGIGTVITAKRELYKTLKEKSLI